MTCLKNFRPTSGQSKTEGPVGRTHSQPARISIAMPKTNCRQLLFSFAEKYRAKSCYRKTGFVSQEAAVASGQRSYWCPVCRLYHRAGPVLPVSNPVLPGGFSLPPSEHKQGLGW